MNEDSFGVDAERGLFVVADGCGGVAEGSPAADAIVASVLAERTPDLTDSLACSVREANERVFAESTSNPEVAGMGATMAALRLHPDGAHAAIVHVGDCRVGELGRTLVQRQDVDSNKQRATVWLTQDHGLWQEAMRRGADANTVEQLRRDHPTVVTRAVGVGASLDIDARYHVAQPGALLVLCSDGLHNQVDNDVITSILCRDVDLSARCAALLGAAEDGGGYDNATVILVQLKNPS